MNRGFGAPLLQRKWLGKKKVHLFHFGTLLGTRFACFGFGFQELQVLLMQDEVGNREWKISDLDSLIDGITPMYRWM